MIHSYTNLNHLPVRCNVGVFAHISERIRIFIRHLKCRRIKQGLTIYYGNVECKVQVL